MDVELQKPRSPVRTELEDTQLWYCLVIFNSDGAQVLIRDEPGGTGLPTISIKPFMRVAHEVTCGIREGIGLRTILLFEVQDPQTRPYAVLEAQGPRSPVPEGSRWASVHSALTVLDADEQAILHSSQAKAQRNPFGVDAAPFSRLGWFERLEKWVTDLIGADRLTDFTQWNGSETFSLIRLQTTRDTLWFKAVGHPNLHEFPITLKLAGVAPAFLPRILGSDTSLSGWLMESAGEETLFGRDDVPAWLNAVRRLAELQILSLDVTNQFLAAGAEDLRVEALRHLVSPFFDVIAELMSQQIKTSPPPLNERELGQLAAAISYALSVMNSAAIPDALGHSDLNPGNVLVRSLDCVFTDWAAAYVGHPFLSLEYLLAHAEKSGRAVAAETQQLRKAYVERWLPITSAEKIQQSISVSPLLAVFACAVSMGSWRDPDRSPQCSAYLRSLTRRMRKEAERINEKALCSRTY